MFGVKRASAHGATPEPSKVSVTKKSSTVKRVAAAAITAPVKNTCSTSRPMAAKITVSGADSILLDTIASLQQEIVALKEVIKNFTEESTETDTVEQYFDSLRLELAEMKEKNCALEAGYKELQIKNELLQQQLDALEEDCVMVVMSDEIESSK